VQHWQGVGMVKFPTPYTVQTQLRVLGEPNKYGEREETWDPPVDQKVYGWAPPGVEDEIFSANRDAVIQDLDVYAPSEFSVFPDDRIIIAGETFRVLGGMRNFDNGPFGFKTGRVVRVKGVKEPGVSVLSSSGSVACSSRFDGFRAWRRNLRKLPTLWRVPLGMVTNRRLVTVRPVPARLWLLPRRKLCVTSLRIAPCFAPFRTGGRDGCSRSR